MLIVFVNRQKICQILGMTNPAVVSESPNKPNITYTVRLSPGTLEETFAPLVEEIKCCRLTTERTIVFVVLMMPVARSLSV